MDVNMKAYDDLKAVGMLADELFDADESLFWMLRVLEETIGNRPPGDTKRILLEGIESKRRQLLALKNAVRKWTENSKAQ